MLILFGLKGCGKSYWARRLSPTAFVDLDLWVTSLHPERKSPQTIWEQEGEASLRCWEEKALRELPSTPVLALGGGTLLWPANRSLLEGRGLWIYLQLDWMTWQQRMERLASPPLCFQKEGMLHYYQERVALFETIPAIRWKVVDGI